MNDLIHHMKPFIDPEVEELVRGLNETERRQLAALLVRWSKEIVALCERKPKRFLVLRHGRFKWN